MDDKAHTTLMVVTVHIVEINLKYLLGDFITIRIVSTLGHVVTERDGVTKYYGSDGRR
ncbi:MAG: hypothetical protein CM15mP106_1250 [Candidatus Neomarinimicrobiota bacterium]|nr:MAG: hypothetical protein CM15mP106_1250 [Candidatus Neomarinimicrobiota bacterium]